MESRDEGSDIETSAKRAAAPRSWALKAALGLMAVGVLAILYVLFAASSKPEAQGYARFATGAMTRLTVLESPPARPDAALIDAEGQTRTLAEYEGEVVLVNLWATWCAPCIEEMPTLAALHDQFDGRGFRVVPVSIDSTADQERAKDLLARLSNNSLPFLTDPSRAILFSAQAGGMPTSILYDRQGNEIARLVGNANWSSPEAVALVEAALAE